MIMKKENDHINMIDLIDYAVTEDPMLSFYKSFNEKQKSMIKDDKDENDNEE